MRLPSGDETAHGGRRARRLLAPGVRTGPRGRQAQAFADAGYPTAVVEYRRPGMPGGGWPGTAEDLTHAVTRSVATPTSTTPGPRRPLGRRAARRLGAAQSWPRHQRRRGLAGGLDLAHGVEKVWAAARHDLARQPAGRRTRRLCRGRPRPARPRHTHVLVHARDDDVVPFELSELCRGAPRAQRAPQPVADGGHYGLIDPSTRRSPGSSRPSTCWPPRLVHACRHHRPVQGPSPRGDRQGRHRQDDGGRGTRAGADATGQAGAAGGGRGTAGHLADLRRPPLGHAETRILQDRSGGQLWAISVDAKAPCASTSRSSTRSARR